MNASAAQENSAGPSAHWRSTQSQPSKNRNREDRAQKMLDNLLRNLWLPRNSPNFPSPLESADVSARWRKCQDRLSLIARHEILDPLAVDADRVPTNFTSVLVKLFGLTRSIPIHDTEPGAAIRSVDSRLMPGVLQAYMMDLLCEKIFHSNEWYATIFGEDTTGMLAKTRQVLFETSGMDLILSITPARG